MTEPTVAGASNDNKLTPTEELICDLLAARHRLGEPFWPIEARNIKALDSLVEKGLITYFGGWNATDRRAKLTAAGRSEFMKTNYVAPVLDPKCRSFYFGPKTNEFRVDCDRKTHGSKKKHRHRWPATRSASAETVTWVDAEARGYASAMYGDQLRAEDARNAAAEADLSTDGGVAP